MVCPRCGGRATNDSIYTDSHLDEFLRCHICGHCWGYQRLIETPIAKSSEEEKARDHRARTRCTVCGRMFSTNKYRPADRCRVCERERKLKWAMAYQREYRKHLRKLPFHAI